MEETIEIDKYNCIQGSIEIDKTKHGEPLESPTTANDNTFYLGKSSKKLKVRELEETLEIDVKKLMLKIDLVVLLPICFLYFIANLNRTHFGFLWYNGIMGSLDISQLQFTLATTTFFIPYVIFQSFSNLTMRHIRPHFWISALVLLYGVVIFCTGFVKNFTGFVVCEFFHGLLQSGCDSAVFYILGHYYERSEGQKRISFLYSFSQLAIMVSNLLSYAIEIHLQNKNGWEAWRWILIIEGSITFSSAFILFFILPDFPEGVRFFNKTEILFIIKKLQIYDGISGYDLSFSFNHVWKQLTDPLLIVPILGTSFMGCMFYSYTFMETFSFTLLGYTRLEGTFRATWTYLAGFFGVILSGFLCDYFNNRAIITSICALLGILGFCLIRFLGNGNAVSSGFKYFGAFCITTGSYSLFPLLLGWCFYNISGHLRRSILISLMIGFFDLGGLYGVWIIYSNGGTMEGANRTMIAGLIMVIICFFIILAYVLVIFKCNKMKRTASYKSKFALLSETDQILLGDKVPSFDYTY